MAIITLTTDFGEKDPFAGAVKGAIYNEMPDMRIVDITHSISPFHIPEAAYIIKNAYKSFPVGTIHIIGVDAELTPENKHLAIKLDGHFFICADNGIMSLLTSEINPEKIVEINIHDAIKTNFPVLDVFVSVACHIARGGTLEVVGKVNEAIKELHYLKAQANNDLTQITGHVIYIDNYGNVVTNINKNIFETIGKGRNFTINARSLKISKIYTSYSQAIDFTINKEQRFDDEGKKLAIFNTSDFIELAMYRSNPQTSGGASSLFGLTYLDTVTVTFK
jgi:hypothetical protein